MKGLLSNERLIQQFWRQRNLFWSARNINKNEQIKGEFFFSSLLAFYRAVSFYNKLCDLSKQQFKQQLLGLKTLVINFNLTNGYLTLHHSVSVQWFNEPLLNVVLDTTNNILQLGQNYSEMYGTEPRYIKPRNSSSSKEQNPENRTLTLPRYNKLIPLRDKTLITNRLTAMEILWLLYCSKHCNEM